MGKKGKTGEVRAIHLQIHCTLHFLTWSYIAHIHKLSGKELSSEVIKFSGSIKLFRVAKAKSGSEKLHKFTRLKEQ